MGGSICLCPLYVVVAVRYLTLYLCVVFVIDVLLLLLFDIYVVVTVRYLTLYVCVVVVIDVLLLLLFDT